MENGNTAGELGQAFLKLLTVVVAGGLGNLSLYLSNTCGNCVL